MPDRLPRVRSVVRIDMNFSVVESPRTVIHDEHVVTYLERASGRYSFGPVWTEVRSPSLSLIAAGQKDLNGLAGTCQGWYCMFEWDALTAAADGFPTLPSPSSPLRLPAWRMLDPDEADRVAALFLSLRDLYARPESSTRLKESAALLELLGILAEETHEDLPGSSAPHPGARLFRRLIEEHACDEGVSLEELAARVGFTPDHLAALFRDSYGMPPVRYRSEVRLGRARELLLHTAKNVSEIAQETGFPDANYFSRLFARRFGDSPRSFRSRVLSRVVRAP